MEQEMIVGIQYKCPCCSEQVKFPTTPNADENKFENLIHSIYSFRASENLPCWRCQFKQDHGKVLRN